MKTKLNKPFIAITCGTLRIVSITHSILEFYTPTDSVLEIRTAERFV